MSEVSQGDDPAGSCSTEPTSASTDVSTPTGSTLSKNKQRKARKYAKLLATRQAKRQKERQVRKEKKLKKSIGNDEKLILANKLKGALNGTRRVVIDCQYDHLMSDKERNRLAQQLRRVYSSNKASKSPVHLIFSNVSESSLFFQTCCKVNDGFERYVVDRQEQSFLDMFKVENIVYLSPDSNTVLSELQPDKVYVIGGLVDETTTKNISLQFCKDNGITCARLPIEEYFEAPKSLGTCKKVLTVNQVFDILLEWYQSRNWTEAITKGVPSRTGFLPKELDLKTEESSSC